MADAKFSKGQTLAFFNGCFDLSIILNAGQSLNAGFLSSKLVFILRTAWPSLYELNMFRNRFRFSELDKDLHGHGCLFHNNFLFCSISHVQT